jgi:hypothetical protein
MKILELFAGSRSMGKAAEELGMAVHSTDLIDFGGIHTVGNILAIPIDYWVAMKPDIIHASPPCTSFSVASIGHHWTGGRGAYCPKTEGARIGIDLMNRTLEIIRACDPEVWFIENPRGMMRMMRAMRFLPIRHTVTYCQYGDTRMKPTDVWTNCTVWKPRPMCKNGSPCHEAAPRGAKTGTQGLNGAHDRSKIPHELCMEMMTAAQRQCRRL